MAAKTSIQIRIPDQSLIQQQEDEEEYEEANFEKEIKEALEGNRIASLFGLSLGAKRSTTIFSRDEEEPRPPGLDDLTGSELGNLLDLEAEFQKLVVPEIVVTEYEEEDLEEEEEEEESSIWCQEEKGKEEETKGEQRPEPKEILQGKIKMRWKG